MSQVIREITGLSYDDDKCQPTTVHCLNSLNGYSRVPPLQKIAALALHNSENDLIIDEGFRYLERLNKHNAFDLMYVKKIPYFDFIVSPLIFDMLSPLKVVPGSKYYIDSEGDFIGITSNLKHLRFPYFTKVGETICPTDCLFTTSKGGHFVVDWRRFEFSCHWYEKFYELMQYITDHSNARWVSVISRRDEHYSFFNDMAAFKYAREHPLRFYIPVSLSWFDVMREMNFKISEVDDFPSYIIDFNNLMQCGDVESNPGPVFSKPIFSRECTIKVGTEGFSDWFNLPQSFSSFSVDFGKFVEKMPDKEALLNVAHDMFTRMESISSRIAESSATVKSIGNKVLESLKSVLIKCIAILIFSVFRVFYGNDSIISTISKFLFNTLGLSATLIGLKKILGIEDKVVTEGVMDDIFTGNAQNILPLAGTAIFSLLFINMFKKQASEGDLKDIFQNAFVFNRGIDSLSGLFDKSFNLWQMITNKLLFKKLGMNISTNQYEASCRIDSFLTRLQHIFSQDFDSLTFDDKKQYRRDVSELHQESVEILLAVDHLPRKNQGGIRQMITLLNQKYTQVISQPLTGKMRLAMFPIVLAGGSGVGKTRLMPILQAIAAKILEEELGVKVSQDNVVALNMDSEHADGYLQQYIIYCNDVFKRKNSETNPSTELDFFMSAIDQAPYPLKMANLAEKGMFFTSLCGIVTTNVIDIAKYAEESQSYTDAICTRLPNTYKVQIKPCYRKYIDEPTKANLERNQKHFQHSIDVNRAKYVVDESSFARLGLRVIPHDNLLDTYTDAEFERMEKRLIPVEELSSPINTNVYVFQKYTLSPCANIGDKMDFTTFVKSFADMFRKHLRSGGVNLQEQTKFFNLPLEEMLKGTPSYVRTEVFQEIKEKIYNWWKPQQEEVLEDGVEEFVECEGYHRHESEAYEHDMSFFTNTYGYLTNFDDLVATGADAPGEFHDFLEYAIRRHGVRFIDDARERSARLRKEREEFFKAEAFRHATFSQKYEMLKQEFLNSSTFKILLNVGVVLGGVAAIYGMTKACKYLINKGVDYTNPNAGKVRDLVESRKLSWFEWLKSFVCLKHIRVTDVNDVPLSFDDLKVLYDFYGILVDPENASPGGKSQQRRRLLRLRVPTQVAAALVENIKGTQFLDEDFCDTVEFDETRINAVMVQTQALMSQLTTTTLDHVIPSSQWFLTINEKKMGNVVFLDGENILMPFHYTEMIASMKNQGKLDMDDPVLFERGCTLRELIHNEGKNEVKTIETKLRYLMNFRRVKSGLPKDNTSADEKDAVIVHIPAKFKSGTTCRNIKNKFIKRKDMVRLSAIQCTGNIFNWRKCEGLLVQNTTNLTDILPVNMITVDRDLPLIETQPHVYEDGTKGELNLILRSRYEYTINSTFGDCGSVLWINDNQVPQGMCGIHVSKAARPGVSCAVPISYEDIVETMAKFVKTEGMEIGIELDELTREELYAPDRIAPDAPFEVLGKIVDRDFKTFQPTKSSWMKSPLGESLDEILYSYERLGKTYDICPKMDKTVLRPFVRNAPGSDDYFVRNGKIYNSDGTKLTESQWEKFRSDGAEYVSPVLKSLRKAKRSIPLFDGAVLARINAYLSKVLSQGGKNGYIDLDQYISSITQTPLKFKIEREYHDEIMIRMYRFVKHQSCLNYFRDKTASNYLLMKEACIKEVEPEDKYERLSVTYLKEAKNYDQISFGIVWPHLFSVIFNQKFIPKDKIRKVFDVRTAVKGIDGNRACKSMNAKSSPGYGGFWSGKPYVNRGFPMGKKCWFGEDYELDETQEDIKIDGNVVCTADQVKCNFKGLKEDVEYLLDVAKKSEPKVIFVATLKDEKRSLEKVKNGDTRAFYQCDMATCIASKCVTGPFWSWYIQNNIENGLAVAINPYGMDWERIAEKMLQFGEGGVIAGDYKAFDLSQGQQVQEIAVDIDRNVAINAGVTDPDQLAQIANMGGALTRKHVLVNGEVLTHIDQAVGSGSPDTVMRDCKCNIINILYIFSEIFDTQRAKREILGIEENFIPYDLTTVDRDSVLYLKYKHLNIVNSTPIPKISLMDVHEYIVWEMCGDDHVIAVAPEIRPWFNQRTLSGMMNEIGMTYTDEKKTGNTPPELRKLEDVTFLKRSFKRVNGYGRKWIGPLDIDVVKEISLWRTNNQSIECPEALQTNMKTALREMALHGEKEYNSMKEFFDFSWNKLYPKSFNVFEDWETAYVAVLNSDSDLDF